MEDFLNLIDEGGTGLLDKVKAKRYHEVHCVPGRDNAQNRFIVQLLDHLEVAERITRSEFQDIVREQQRTELERFFLSLDIHKILADATTQNFGASLDALVRLALKKAAR